MKKLSLAFALVVGSVAGCAEPQVGEVDEPVTELSSALASTFTLHNFQTGLCLGVAAGNPAYNTPLITWTCDGSSNQRWSAVPKTQGDTSYYQLKNSIADNHCMDVASNTNGSAGRTNSCWTLGGGQMPGSTIQLPGWKLLYAGTDFSGHECYRFQHQGGTVVLGVSGGNQNKGAQTIVWTDFFDPYNHADQFWCAY